jgi:hypothetical protein
MRVVDVRAYGGIAGLVKAGGVYCGRPGILGNPCSEPNVPCPVCDQVHFGPKMVQLTECRSIPCYRKWLWERLRERDGKVLTAMAKLRADSLVGCWCSPKPRHLDVMAKAWEWAKLEGLI